MLFLQGVDAGVPGRFVSPWRGGLLPAYF